MLQEIPIFFSTDDNYIPYLDVAISSLIDNASKEYRYRIVVLNTGLESENVNKIKLNEREGFKIDFIDISDNLKKIMSYFKNVYHFSIVTYYRLFIASLFPDYEKIIYLDCDLVVLGDISTLYNTSIGECIVGAVPDQHVQSTREFRDYAKIAIDVDPDDYFNAGVLLINLKEFRNNKIEEKFVDLITKYDFDLLDPDQAYLNYLCKDKVYRLSNGWNKEPLTFACEGDKNIVHYALYKKPWQYDDVTDGEYFWLYAKKSPFYKKILQNRACFGVEEKIKKEQDAKKIIEHAKAITACDYTFSKIISRRDQYGKIST